MKLPFLYLAMAIIAEIFATTALKLCEGFTRPGWTAVVVIGYGAAFYLLSQALKGVSLGAAYAIWSGAGIAIIALIGHFFLRQRLDAPALIGLALIITGIVVMNLFSNSVSH